MSESVATPRGGASTWRRWSGVSFERSSGKGFLSTWELEKLLERHQMIDDCQRSRRIRSVERNREEIVVADGARIERNVRVEAETRRALWPQTRMRDRNCAEVDFAVGEETIQLAQG